MSVDAPSETHPAPSDERQALVQRLDRYRANGSTVARRRSVAGGVGASLGCILVHMIGESAQHVGHLDLLRDALARG